MGRTFKQKHTWVAHFAHTLVGANAIDTFGVCGADSTITFIYIDLTVGTSKTRSTLTLVTSDRVFAHSAVPAWAGTALLQILKMPHQTISEYNSNENCHPFTARNLVWRYQNILRLSATTSPSGST